MKALSTIVMRTEFLRSIGTQPDALGATLAHGTRGCQATTVPARPWLCRVRGLLTCVTHGAPAAEARLLRVLTG